MPCCDFCGKQGTIIAQTFPKDTGLEPLNLCRVCRGKLILSLPKNASPDQMRMTINKLYDRAQEEKKHKGSRRY